jgi:hypothetical protein
MTTGKAIGYLLIAGAIGVLAPYTILTFAFDYPQILREESSIILNGASQPQLNSSNAACYIIILPTRKG